VDQVLRRTIRDIRLSQIDFEIQRAAVLVAIVKVDLAELNLTKPPPKGQNAVSDTAARDLIDALNELLRAQNDFLAVWVDYQAQRMSLDFDLGTMELDTQGIWVDPGPIIGENLEQEVGVGPTVGAGEGTPTEGIPPGEPIEPLPGPPNEETSPLLETVPPMEDGQNPQSLRRTPNSDDGEIPLKLATRSTTTNRPSDRARPVLARAPDPTTGEAIQIEAPSREMGPRETPISSPVGKEANDKWFLDRVGGALAPLWSDSSDRQTDDTSDPRQTAQEKTWLR
jgi:hypothetical protein